MKCAHCGQEMHGFQSPIWWGWECDMAMGIGRVSNGYGVSIPDLVGLGMRPDLPESAWIDVIVFQSPIWWGWECD